MGLSQKELLGRLELNGVLIETDVLHTAQAVITGAWGKGWSSFQPANRSGHSLEDNRQQIMVTPFSAALGMAISQACYATGENHERALLRQLLDELDPEGVLVQEDALHSQQPLFGNSRSREPTSC